MCKRPARPTGEVYVCGNKSICDRCMHVASLPMNGAVCVCTRFAHVRSACNNCVPNRSCRHTYIYIITHGSVGNVVMHVRHVHVYVRRCLQVVYRSATLCSVACVCMHLLKRVCWSCSALHICSQVDCKYATQSGSNIRETSTQYRISIFSLLLSFYGKHLELCLS